MLMRILGSLILILELMLVKKDILLIENDCDDLDVTRTVVDTGLRNGSS